MFKNITLIFFISCCFIQRLNAQKSPKAVGYILKGEVRDANTNAPMKGAYISFDFQVSVAQTDTAGKFTVLMPRSEMSIKVSYQGYKPFRTKLKMVADDFLYVELEEVSKMLEEVVVSSTSNRKDIHNPSLGVTILSMKGIKKIPAMMGEVDILRSLQMLPGVSSVGEGANGLNIRGGNVDQNVIYIDDTPIFNPTHLFGLFSVFAADAIREVELYKGSVPARFGGRTASVLDIKMSEPNLTKFKLNGGIGIISNRLLLETPIIKDKLGILLAGRASFNDFLFKWVGPPNFKKTKANFFDLAGKIFYKPNTKNTISLSTYLSKDLYRVDSLFSLENIIARQTNFDYGHQNLSLNWSHFVNSKLSYNATLVNSNYKTNTSSEDSINAINLDNNIAYKKVKFNVDYSPSTVNSMQFGLSAIRYDIIPGTLNKNLISKIASVDLPKEQSMELGIYVENEWKASKKLTLQFGLRYSHYLSLGNTTVLKYNVNEPKSPFTIIDSVKFGKNEVAKSYGGLEPRFAMKYTISENSTLKIGYNRNQQFLQLVSNNTTPLPTARWKTADEHIKPQVSDFFTAGYFKTYNENIFETSMELYYRDTKNILDYTSGANLQLNKNIEDQLINGIGKAYGMEIQLTKKRGEFSGWLSYTYSRALQKVTGDFPDQQKISGGNWYPANYDKPHNVNLMLNLQPSSIHSFSFTFAYSTGRPFSSPIGIYSVGGQKFPVFSDRNSDRISDYHRLDFNWTIDNPINKDRMFKGSWNFTVYNLYGHKNAYSVFFKSVPYGIQAYKLSVFAAPIISLGYNFKFL